MNIKLGRGLKRQGKFVIMNLKLKYPILNEF